MTTKRSIPQVPLSTDPQRRQFDTALKENLEVLTGRIRGTTLEPLDSTAALSDVIAKVNALIAHLQG